MGLLKQRFTDKYETNIEETYVSCVAAFNEQNMNIDVLKNDVNELGVKLANMGQVNLLAIEEFDRLNERLDFLTKQRDDLVKSIEDLKYAIKRIDETSRERFKKVFELVNEKFQRFFPILFGGGKANLVMTEPEDLLATGIDIVAQLPGKKTQNINLFSGGEKALTAISLVFSIFAIKPSPFCVLDEVDAPLDDANITRFNEAIRALMDRTQFVLITHNKRTMEMVDVLYGVTMEEPGVSRMVAVKIAALEQTKAEENTENNYMSAEASA
jgi:chromosome segregation protein